MSSFPSKKWSSVMKQIKRYVLLLSVFSHQLVRRLLFYKNYIKNKTPLF